MTINEAQALRALLAREAPPPDTQPAIFQPGAHPRRNKQTLPTIRYPKLILRVPGTTNP